MALRAPLDGVVQRIAFRNPGAVIRPAETVIEVVPANLPKTGSEEGGNPTALFAAFGLLLLGMLLLGRRDPRGCRRTVPRRRRSGRDR